MLDNLQATDPKVLERIAKLLNITVERGATEAEALNAAERARKMMDDYGLEQATVEAAGGAGERRDEAKLEGLAGEWWQPPLMTKIAETCYVYSEHVTKKDAARRTLGAGFRLIGRESAVATARILYEYLCECVYRCCREAEAEHRERGQSFVKKHFRRAMGERLCERIAEEHRKGLQRQEGEARAKAAAQAAAGTSNALVVTLVDYQQREADLNEDYRRGLPPGTTAARREERERKNQKYRDEQARRRVELREQGVPDDVAQFMLYGYTRERAEEIVADNSTKKLDSPKPKTAKQQQREEAADARYWKRWQRKRDAEDARRSSPSWRAGQKAGSEVSLNRQVDDRPVRKLTD